MTENFEIKNGILKNKPESVIDIDNDAFFNLPPEPNPDIEQLLEKTLMPGFVRIDTSHPRPPGLTFSGVPGGFAEKWAKLHEIPFKQSEVAL